jgi:hypothetical protein
LYFAVAVVVAELELPARLVFLPEAHQVDAQLRAPGPEARVELDSLAVVGDAFLVAAILHEVKRDHRVTVAVRRVDREHLLEPGVRSTIGYELRGGMDCHRVN